jgi:hypothetical protein
MPTKRTLPILDALPADAPWPRRQAGKAPQEETILDAIPVSPAPVLKAILIEDEPDVQPLPGTRRPFLVRMVLGLVWGIAALLEWLFGTAVLMVGLAVLAGLPILQFLSLGYLLEAGARVARSGRFRDGFIGMRLASRLGGIVVGSFLFLLPVRIVAGLARDASVIDPGGPIARGWRIALMVLIGLTFLHIGLACARGGRLRYFFWPFNFIWMIRRLLRGGYYVEARDAVWDTVMTLRLPYYFGLGVRGFLGALAWLVIPISLLALGSRGSNPGLILLGYLGAFSLAIVLLYLPFLQMRLAEVNRLSAVFDLRAVRAAYGRAPWAFALAFVVTLLSAVPLYLLKVELIPKEATWLPALFFIAFIFPARLLTGWALGRAKRRDIPRHWFFRWTTRVPLLPAALFYVLIVYFTQFTSWNGVWSLYEQHAFLVPVPFFGG